MEAFSIYHRIWWPLFFFAQFSSVEEAVSVVGQVAGALAVGETVSPLPPTATTVSLSHTNTHTHGVASGTRDGAPRSTPVQHPGQKDETKVIHLQTRQPGVFPALSRSQGYRGGLHSLQSEARCICLPVECTLSSPVKPDQLSLFIIIGFISFGISVSVDCSISVLAPLGDYKTADECVSYHDLEQLPWLFEGRGDLQFDVYRDMRKITGCVSRCC